MNYTRYAQVFMFAMTLACARVHAQVDYPEDQPKTNAPIGRSVLDYENYAVLRLGDATVGRALFFDEKKMACSLCHSIDGSNSKMGPDLQAVGDKFGRREIVESILKPSALITEGYSGVQVETKAGAEISGVLKQSTPEWIEVMGVSGGPQRIPLSDIKTRRMSAISLMPEGLHIAITPQEFTGLIDFLVSLKTPDSANLVKFGMPAEIPKIPQPITMRPIHGDNLRFEHPVWFGQMPVLSNAFLVVEHESGKIWLFEQKPGGPQKSVFAELGEFQKGTRGLLGIALHAKFRENRKYYTAKQIVDNGQFTTFVYEWEAASDFRHDSGKPGRLIFRFDEGSGVHYGGGMVFGPDGYFYVGMGDGGPQEDPNGCGQNLGIFLGKMLRIDPDRPAGGLPYAIPQDNPFVGRDGVRPEIWAYGFREPWRFSFDPVTKEFWVGDVGQDRYEEVDIVRKGENYGWNVYEGFERFSNKYRRDKETFVPPVFAYNRKNGPSVTGGFVYRANPQSPFYGMYIFGDYESKRIWAMTQKDRALKSIVQIGTCPQRITSFGIDDAGQLYIAGYEGTIYLLDLDHARME